MERVVLEVDIGKDKFLWSSLENEVRLSKHQSVRLHNRDMEVVGSLHMEVFLSTLNL
jgi:hypothetical protein